MVKQNTKSVLVEVIAGVKAARQAGVGTAIRVRAVSIGALIGVGGSDDRAGPAATGCFCFPLLITTKSTVADTMFYAKKKRKVRGLGKGEAAGEEMQAESEIDGRTCVKEPSR